MRKYEVDSDSSYLIEAIVIQEGRYQARVAQIDMLVRLISQLIFIGLAILVAFPIKFHFLVISSLLLTMVNVGWQIRLPQDAKYFERICISMHFATFYT